MPLDLPKALIDAGGWVCAAAVSIGVITAIIRGDLVPGNIYRREVSRADAATTQLERQNAFGDRITAQVEMLVKLVAEVLKR